jgi:hypothetical protein
LLSDGRLRHEPPDGLIGVILDDRVAQLGHDLGLVDDRPGDGVGRAGVEETALQRRVGDGVDEPRGADFELVTDPQRRMTYGMTRRLAMMRMGAG